MAEIESVAATETRHVSPEKRDNHSPEKRRAAAALTLLRENGDLEKLLRCDETLSPEEQWPTSAIRGGFTIKNSRLVKRRRYDARVFNGLLRDPLNPFD
ncbi:MAG: hypothetical protein CMI16_07530 [Opitutaceae bacterium]|nr:hypothetical protein [Opitutaceae bacterium]|tara:strand:+ start:576 stop:872 length:297 start_codon:yes stop_codon:yes gene_type:complete